MKNKKIIISIVIFVILMISIFLIFFKDNTAKNLKIGNNTTSQEIVNNILNINNYEAIIEVKVISNKNENCYILKQKYNGIDDNSQEVLEPSNIAGVKIIKNGKTLKLENTNLSLTSLFENYEYISDNSLDLNSFIKDYKENQKSEWKENENEVIMKTSSESKIRKNKTLYISKNTGKPIKMEIEDANKNIAVYILYNEVTVNSLITISLLRTIFKII